MHGIGFIALENQTVVDIKNESMKTDFDNVGRKLERHP